VVVPSELKKSLSQILDWTRDSLVVAEERLDLKLVEGVDLYFDTRPLFHNGLTTVVPRNRISVNTEAPELNSSIGVTRFYLFETLVHEWAHMLSIQEHRGVFKIFSWLVGNTSRPNGAWPRWIHEGLAVWTEKAVGGRPLSGSVDFDLRRFAEFEARTGRPALTNSQLDGQWDLSKFRSGQVPYTFGYLLLEHLTEKKKFSLGRYAETSSRSLGISFRKTFEEVGVSLDESFEEARKEWAATPLAHKTTNTLLVARAQEIRGLKALGDQIAWIEVRDDNDVRLVASDGKTSLEEKWPLNLLPPLEATPLPSPPGQQKWAVLVDALPAWLRSSFHTPATPSRRHLALYESKGAAFGCVFDLDERLREAEVSTDKIVWVSSRDDGAFEMKEANWNGACQLTNRKTLLTTLPFERLTAPSFSSDATVVTRNVPSKDRFDERVIDTRGRSLVGSKTLLTQYAPGVSSSIGVIFERSPSYWGPLLTRASGDKIKTFRLPLRTGAFEAAIGPAAKIYYVEKLWDNDELRSVAVDDASLVAAEELRWENAPSPVSDDATKTRPEATPETHGPLDDMWPHFWIPSLVAGDGAWILAGQTFYSDLTQTWNGATLVGYNTQTARPFGSSTLSWVPSSRALRPQVDVGLSYDPRDVSYFALESQTVQERAAASVSLSLPYTLAGRWRGNVSLGYLFAYYGRLGRFGASQENDPLLRLSLRSPYGQDPYQTLSRLSESPGFTYFDARARWIETLDFRTNAYALFRSSQNSRVLVALQGAHTSYENFPRSYFLWGGTPVLGASYDGDYVNRGFPLQGFIARNLVRGSSEWIYGLWDPRSSLSWNRFRLQSVDLRLVGESITWDPMLGTRFRLGKTFSSSAGTEVDILGSGLHYVSYKLSLGVFQGFGDFAETRYTALLKVGLDL
jgi:hypothetical protein